MEGAETAADLPQQSAGPIQACALGIGDIEVCRGHPKMMLQFKFRLQLPPLHHTQGSHVLRVRCLYCRSAVPNLQWPS